MSICKSRFYAILLLLMGISSVYAQNNPSQSFMSRYEFWIDEDYLHKQAYVYSGSIVNLEVNCASLAQGVHLFNFRGQNPNAEYGPLHQSFFYVDKSEIEGKNLTEYEYWVDDPSTRNCVKSLERTIALSLPMDDLSIGVHNFYFRSRAENGIWGDLYQTMFVRSCAAEEKGSMIVGYRYSFGGKYTEISISPRVSYQLNNYKIDLPNLKEVGSLTEGCSYTFSLSNVRLNRTQKVTFNIQFKDEIDNWSSPTCYDFEMNDVVLHDYVTLSTTHRACLEKVPKGDFHAFKCVVNQDLNYYLKSSVPCNIDLYKSNGTILTKLTPDDLDRAYSIGLSKGTYYGIMYNMPDDVSLRLLTFEDYVVDPVIAYENETLTITCSQPGASIYYTIDGTDPSETSSKYNAPVALKRNCTVKAVATYPGMSSSDIISYVIDGYKVAMPAIDFIDSKFVLSTKTDGAIIYYTTDETIPSDKSSKYTTPISIDKSCTIKAIGILDGWYDSEVASYIFDADAIRCFTPQIKKEGNTIVISSSTNGATVNYTTDGSIPNPQSSVYSAPITVKHNMVVNAIAMKENYLDSPMATFNVDWFKVETPQFAFANNHLTIYTYPEEAKIRYTMDGSLPTESSIEYTNPIEINENSTIRAIGFLANYAPSEVATYIVGNYTCDPVSIDYDGRYIKLTTTTTDAEIHYTVDGSFPTTASAKYVAPFDVKGITTVRAVVNRNNYNNSVESSYSTPCYYDGKTVLVNESGSISTAFEWCGVENIGTLDIEGTIDGADITYISSMPALRHLNMEDANVVDNTIISNAFVNSPLVSVSFPKSLMDVGNSLFIGCNSIAAVIWNANMPLPLSALLGVSNPNLLLYVRLNSYAPASVKNVVANGIAEEITLYDGNDNGNNNFYCPREFTAKTISYKHNYLQKTFIGQCAGWETIALPFDVQTITHLQNGELAPFATNSSLAKPFWLYSLDTFGFKADTEIRANTPYIISMPNNLDYADEYIQSGEVTFSAKNAVVPATSQNTVIKGEFLFIPTTMKVGQDASVYAINKELEYESQQPGSMFVGDLRSVSPFEGYLTFAGHAAKIPSIKLNDLGFSDDVAGIAIPTKADGLKIWSANGIISIEAYKPETVRIYAASGALIRSVDLHEGMNVVNGLVPGIYIVGKTKVIVK